MPLSVVISTVKLGTLSGSGKKRERVALYSGYTDMGLATSTSVVDHEPGAGVYAGGCRFGFVFTNRTPVILSLLFSSIQVGAACAASAPAGTVERKWRRFIGLDLLGRGLVYYAMPDHRHASSAL